MLTHRLCLRASAFRTVLLLDSSRGSQAAPHKVTATGSLSPPTLHWLLLVPPSEMPRDGRPPAARLTPLRSSPHSCHLVSVASARTRLLDVSQTTQAPSWFGAFTRAISFSLSDSIMYLHVADPVIWVSAYVTFQIGASWLHRPMWPAGSSSSPLPVCFSHATPLLLMPGL